MATPAPQWAPQPQYLSVLTQATVVNSMATFANTAALVKATSAQKVGGAAGQTQAPKAGAAAGREAEALGQKLRALGSAMSVVFDQGRASITSLVAAADPSAFSTFNARLTSFSISVGREFVPALQSVGNTVADLGGAFGRSDPLFKGFLVNSTLAIVGVSALGHALRFFTPAARLATSAVVLFNTAWRASPLGLIIGGVIAAAGALSWWANSWSGVGKAARSAGEDMEAAARRAERAMRPNEHLFDWMRRAIIPEIGGGGGRPENLQLPFQSRATTFEQYGERLQTEALQTNDADRENQIAVMREMLKRMEGQEQLLRQIASGGGMERALRGMFG